MMNLNVNSLVNRVRDRVEQYRGTDIERKVKEATSSESWGVKGATKEEIARATYDYTGYNEVMPIVWRRMGESGKNWRMVFKSLDLLEFLLKRGSERVITEARERQYQIRTLRDFHFTDVDGRDRGAGVREKSVALCELLNSDSLLRKEREVAKDLQGKFVGMGAYGATSSSVGGGFGSSGQGNYGSDPRFDSGSNLDDSRERRSKERKKKKDKDKEEKKSKKPKKKKKKDLAYGMDGDDDNSRDSDDDSDRSDVDSFESEESPSPVKKSHKKKHKKKEKAADVDAESEKDSKKGRAGSKKSKKNRKKSKENSTPPKLGGPPAGIEVPDLLGGPPMMAEAAQDQSSSFDMFAAAPASADLFGAEQPPANVSGADDDNWGFADDFVGASAAQSPIAAAPVAAAGGDLLDFGAFVSSAPAPDPAPTPAAVPDLFSSPPPPQQQSSQANPDLFGGFTSAAENETPITDSFGFVAPSTQSQATSKPAPSTKPKESKPAAPSDACWDSNLVNLGNLSLGSSKSAQNTLPHMGLPNRAAPAMAASSNPALYGLPRQQAPPQAYGFNNGMGSHQAAQTAYGMQGSAMAYGMGSPQAQAQAQAYQQQQQHQQQQQQAFAGFGFPSTPPSQQEQPNPYLFG